MADVAARREARRRKILENSQSRLKLISGEHNGPIHVSETEVLSSNVQYNDDNTKIEPAIEAILNNVKHNHENNIHDEIGLRNLTPDNMDITALINTDAPDSSNNPQNYIKYSKLFVISLAIIIRLLFIFQMQFCVRDSIILPFIIFELTLQYFRSNVENNAFLNTFLLLSSLPPNRVKFITRIFKFFANFTTDFCLYFFTFLILHVFLEYFI